MHSSSPEAGRRRVPGWGFTLDASPCELEWRPCTRRKDWRFERLRPTMRCILRNTPRHFSSAATTTAARGRASALTTRPHRVRAVCAASSGASRPLTRHPWRPTLGHLDIYHRGRGRDAPRRRRTGITDGRPDVRDNAAARDYAPCNRKQDSLGVDERRLREEIGFYSHLLVDLGLLEFKGGNLSVRIDDDMLITKRSVAKAHPEPRRHRSDVDLPRGRGRLPGIERDGDPPGDLQGDRCARP